MNATRRTPILLAACLMTALLMIAAVALPTTQDEASTRKAVFGATASDLMPDTPPHQEKPDDPPGLNPARPVKPGQGGGANLLFPPGMPPSIQVNIDGNGNNIPGDAANEPSITIDPTNPDRMAIGWRQFDTISSNFRQAGWAFTTDAGQSWTFPGRIEPGVFRSDPVLDTDVNGRFYYNSLMGDFTIDLFMSDDGGQTWGPRNPAFGGDKQWMAIDRTGGIGTGHIYISWSMFAGCCGDRTYTRSTDGGFTYSEPIEVPLNPLFGTVAVGRDGEFYVSGVINFPEVYGFARSSNASDQNQSTVFEFASDVDLGGSMVFQAGPNPSGLLGQSWVAADHSDGALGGNVYMLGSVNPPGGDPLDVMFIRSEDNGVTWSEPVRVNDDSGNAWQWFGTMSVAPNGRIDVVWNDTRADNDVVFSELYTSSSFDGGVTWAANVAISPPFNHHLGYPQQNKLGDYYDMISDNTGASLAWAATFNGEQDVYYLRLPIATIAPLKDVEVTFGSLINGGIDELAASDGDELHARSSIGFTAIEPNVMEMVVGATAAVPDPAALDLSIESRIDHPGGAVKIRLRNWGTNGFDQINVFSVGTMETTVPMLDVDPTNRVRAEDSRIEVSLRYVVAATFTAQGFDVFVDQVEVLSR